MDRSFADSGGERRFLLASTRSLRTRRHRKRESWGSATSRPGVWPAELLACRAKPLGGRVSSSNSRSYLAIVVTGYARSFPRSGWSCYYPRPFSVVINSRRNSVHQNCLLLWTWSGVEPASPLLVRAGKHARGFPSFGGVLCVAWGGPAIGAADRTLDWWTACNAQRRCCHRGLEGARASWQCAASPREVYLDPA